MQHAGTEYLDEVEDELKAILRGCRSSSDWTVCGPAERLRGLTPEKCRGLTDEQAQRLRELLERRRGK